jgi:hypothetical protein
MQAAEADVIQVQVVADRAVAATAILLAVLKTMQHITAAAAAAAGITETPAAVQAIKA